MNGPIPTIAFMFSATASGSPSPLSSCSSGWDVGMFGAKRAKHIRCEEAPKASDGVPHLRFEDSRATLNPSACFKRP